MAEENVNPLAITWATVFSCAAIVSAVQQVFLMNNSVFLITTLDRLGSFDCLASCQCPYHDQASQQLFSTQPQSYMKLGWNVFKQTQYQVAI